MRKSKVLSLILTVALGTTLLFGCGSKDTSGTADEGNKQVSITFLNSKGEIQTQLEDAAKTFTEQNPDINVEIVVASTGQSPFEKISALYASGNAPTLAMLDPSDFSKMEDKFLDLSNEKWVSDAVEGTLDSTKTADGKVITFPFAIEGAGFIYNKQLTDKAGIDVTSIKTINDLENAFKKVKEAGSEPVVISPMDWSLAAHLLGVGYSDQSSDTKELNKFFENLKAGTEDLSTNKAVNGLLDTFDIMKQYNMDAKDPLAGTYENDQQYMGSGEVAFWFMGNWTWPQVEEFAGDNKDFGFIPVPVSNNAADYGNEGLMVGATKCIGIDKENNNADQQAAAKKFLEWIVYDAKGQDFIVNKANIIPAFKNITLEPQDPLAKSIKSYMNDGKTIQFITTLPSDHWKEVGASMQKYLAGQSDRATLLKDIENYWKQVK